MSRNIYAHALHGNVFSFYWNDAPKCAHCGAELHYQDMQRCANDGVAPSCPECHFSVFSEMALNMPIWSNDFYGHWCQTPDYDGWVQI